jgi:ABC-type Fe3+/spermidine/putrescine transport system ATPase subunit
MPKGAADEVESLALAGGQPVALTPRVVGSDPKQIALLNITSSSAIRLFMGSLSIRELSKTFGNTQVLKAVSFEVQAGEFFSLLGPSGCGKSTLLRIIAGLETADSGSVGIDANVIDSVAPQHRGIGMVFQQYALWPHMTVAQNVRFGLDNLSLSNAERAQRMNEALAIVRMQELKNRFPHEISGGQQQRVALARALAMKPAIILLDEPLSNLDARLRAEIRQELSELHRELKTTMIYVTHDQEDALALSTRIAIIDRGEIQQIGTPREIYEQPRSPFTARFIGDANLLPCTLLTQSTGSPRTVRLKLGNQAVIPLAADGPVSASSIDGFLCIRPAALRVGGAPRTAGPELSARVRRITYRGSDYDVELLIDDSTALHATIRADTADQALPNALREGCAISVSWETCSAVFIPGSQ